MLRNPSSTTCCTSHIKASRHGEQRARCVERPLPPQIGGCSIHPAAEGETERGAAAYAAGPPATATGAGAVMRKRSGSRGKQRGSRRRPAPLTNPGRTASPDARRGHPQCARLVTGTTGVRMAAEDLPCPWTGPLPHDEKVGGPVCRPEVDPVEEVVTGAAVGVDGRRPGRDVGDPGA